MEARPKPRAIRWLEEQTGQTIPYEAEQATRHDRHLSIRLSDELHAGLGGLARERRVSLSQLVRDVLAETVVEHRSLRSMEAQALVDRLTADVAEVRRPLTG